MFMSPATIVAPEDTAVTLQQAKQFLRMDSPVFDAELATHVAGACGQIEAITGTRFIEQTVLLRAGSFRDLELLPIGPVQDVTDIAYLDAAGGVQTLDPDTYELFGAGLEKGLRPAAGGAWPSTRGAADAVRVTAIVGYGASADVPDAVRTAIFLTIKALFEGNPIDVDSWLVNDRIWL
jgi:uncharacterized phiE125 gp8 family phage protein